VNLRAVNNSQSREEVQVAVNSALNNIAASGAFMASSYTGTVAVDANQNGSTSDSVDYNVTVTSTCIAKTQIANKDLDMTDVHQAVCQDSGYFSHCYWVRWDLKGTATDPATGASVETHLGVRTGMTLDETIASACP
jgi:hypothetical protein